MEPKVNKGKGVASSSHGSKRARILSEDEHEDVNMAPVQLRRYGLHWVIEKEVGPGYEEPLDDDVSTEDEMTRVDSDIESSDDDEEDSEMGEAALAPTDYEE
ncbi:hypothetical protein HAX54_048950 [Datura stramonium]|uniref:Uncharacterized protein n=1 Tax=Datura stramonium TaxID=4076 RepID=A0ABS8WJX8_DATST|nr:hypothetical protein [Datura stramonium]